MRAFLTEFCSTSSIHGVRYFTEKRRHWSERCWWVIALFISFYLCGNAIYGYWLNWHEFPVTLSFGESDPPISTIPFPSVVICPGIKAVKGKLDLSANFFNSTQENAKNFSRTELGRLDAFGLVCDSNDDFFKTGNKFTNDSIYNIIKDIATDFNTTMGYCAPPSEEDSECSAIFTPIWTAAGICFAFNALNSHEVYTEEMAPELNIATGNPNQSHWTLHYGYDDKIVKENEYPIRVFSGKSVALASLIRLFDKDVGSHCGEGTGFDVGFAIPGDSINFPSDFIYIEMNQVAEISIKPKAIITPESLLSYSPNQRQCFFGFERQLHFFKMYTKNNCEAECLTSFTRLQCGCVKYSMPRNSSTKICGPGNIKCYRDARWKLFGIDVIDGMKDKAAREFREECNCLPACTTITYEAEIDKNKFDDELTGGQQTYMTVSFRHPHVVTLKRSQKYTFTDFLAVCGGLFGLFLGVSLLSIVEFAYFFTLRLFWTIRKSRSKNVVVPIQQKTSNSIFVDVSN